MKLIFSLLLISFFLTIVPCLAENEEKVYTDQDLSELDYEHKTEKIMNQKKQQIIEEPTPQQIVEEKIRLQEQQKEIQQQQRQMNIKKVIEYTETAAGTFLFFFIIMPGIYWIIALVSVLKNEFTESNKIIWFLAITFLPIIGPILYLFIGDKYKIYPYENDPNYEKIRRQMSVRIKQIPKGSRFQLSSTKRPDLSEKKIVV